MRRKVEHEGYLQEVSKTYSIHTGQKKKAKAKSVEYPQNEMLMSGQSQVIIYIYHCTHVNQT